LCSDRRPTCRDHQLLVGYCGHSRSAVLRLNQMSIPTSIRILDLPLIVVLIQANRILKTPRHLYSTIQLDSTFSPIETRSKDCLQYLFLHTMSAPNPINRAAGQKASATPHVVAAKKEAVKPPTKPAVSSTPRATGAGAAGGQATGPSATSSTQRRVSPSPNAGGATASSRSTAVVVD
jgi:hypothetical protein